MKVKASQTEVAERVREALSDVPEYEEFDFKVIEQGIYASNVGDSVWWRVPIIPNPWPKRRTALYEALAEVEERLSDHGLPILLFLGEHPEPVVA